MDRAVAPPLCRFLPPRYRFDRVLSDGERNTTLEVFDTSLRQAKAVVKIQKLAEEKDATEAEGEFRRFCANLVSIRHDLIAVPYTFGTFSSNSGGTFGYSVREFVSGAPLSTLSLPISAEAATTVILQVCRGLGAVHAMGLYHCDLKADNIIVRRAPAGHIDGLSQCVLIDFSYRASAAAGALTEVTLQHVAPEMLTGQPPNAHTDLYALGVMLYRLLSGRSPFDGGSLPEIMRKQRSREFAPLKAIRSSVPSNLRKAVEGLLEPNPANRPESVHALIAVIDQHNNSAPTPRPSTPQHGWFVGRSAEINTCLAALNVERPSAGATSIAVSGARGSGVTAFLRELQDRLETQGVIVLTCTPRALQGEALQKQLCAAVHALVRQPTTPTAVARVHAPDTSTELLDDMFTVAHDRRVVLFIDDWSLCDVSEKGFVQRLIRQDKAASQGTPGRSGRCQVVIGDSRKGERAETRDALSGMVEHCIDLQGLGQQETAALLASAGSVPKLYAARILAASEGNPKAIHFLLSHVAENGLEGSVDSAQTSLLAVADSAADADKERDVCALRGAAYGDALLALALWGDDLSPERWRALLEHSGSPPVAPPLVDYVGRHRFVRSRHQHLGEYLARRASTAELTKLAAGVLAITWADWRSSDPESLLPLLRFVCRLGHLPRRCGHRVCRALIILLERGRLADLESVTTAMAHFHAPVPWWVMLFREAARAGTLGRTPASEKTIAVIDGPASFFTSWLRARQLMRARYRQEALHILDALAASQLPCARTVAVALAEDHALAIAEAGSLDRVVSIKRSILQHVRRWLPCVRTRSMPRDATTTGVRVRACRKLARYQRIRGRAHLRAGRWKRALAACKRERLLNRADRNLLREASCLNNEGILLIRTHAERAAVPVLERCVQLRGRLDDEHGVVIALNNLAAALSVGGNLGGAAAALNRARIIATRNGLGRLRNLALVNLAVAYSKKGQLVDAQRALRQARRHSRDEGDVDALARSLHGSGSVSADRWKPVAAERYAAATDRVVSSRVDCPQDVSGDLIRAEMAYRNRDWAHLHTVTSRLGQRGSRPDTIVYETRLAVEAGETIKKRSIALEHACTPGARLRLVLLRRRGNITWTSLTRVVALARRQGLAREATEWIVAHLAQADGGSASGVDLGLQALAWFEFREGHDDLQIELRSRLAGTLRARGRHAEAWRLIEDALLRFRDLERKLRRWPRGVHVLLYLQTVVQRGLTGSVAERPGAGQALSAALCAQAFELLLDSRQTRPGTHDRQAEVLPRLGAAVSKGGHGEQLLDELLGVALSVTGAQRAILVVGTASDRSVRRTVLAEGGGTGLEAAEISWAVVSQVLASGEASVFGDALTAEELASHRSIAVLKLRSLACVPLRCGGQVLGALYLDHHGIAGLVSQDMLGLLELLAGIIGITLHTRRLEEQAGAARRELAETHRHIMRAERNRVAGELAGGLVHDLKNVLAAISGRAQLLRRASQDAHVLRSLDSIEKAAGTGVGLVQRLQECARDHSSQSEEPVDLTAVVYEAVELLSPRLEKNRVRADIQGGPDTVAWGVAGEYRELFLNLFVNACDAMPEGGTLSVALSVDPQGGQVVVTVSDTGVGMSAETQARLFEPFYTTKGNGGTGLGLVVVKSVVVRHGGSIAVQSEPGAGTRFHVALPRPRR